MRTQYTDKELKYFEELTDSLILWLFSTRDKRYAIMTSLKTAYDKGLKKKT